MEVPFLFERIKKATLLNLSMKKMAKYTKGTNFKAMGGSRKLRTCFSSSHNIFEERNSGGIYT